MLVTDPIADMLTRIRNALIVKHDTVDVPVSLTKVTSRVTPSAAKAFRR